MFTGIIRHVGRVASVRRKPRARAIVIELGPLAEGARPGDSVSVDGVCLTATGLTGSLAAFDVGAETLQRSTLGELTTGSEVNLEPALCAGDPLGGHFVSGHVDGVGAIRLLEKRAGEVRLRVETPAELSDQMIIKGSVAVDGISLTVAALETGAFEASIIPYTLQSTTLAHKAAGERVNIECDMIGRWVRRILRQRPGAALADGLSFEKLEEEGF
ncbi:MAG: riboflavin synthase [Planctomycetes bacterium]|nr:riboflavin synthase [Planctomycetota bacterium]